LKRIWPGRQSLSWHFDQGYLVSSQMKQATSRLLQTPDESYRHKSWQSSIARRSQFDESGCFKIRQLRIVHGNLKWLVKRNLWGGERREFLGVYHPPQKGGFWPFWRNCEGRTDAAMVRNLKSDSHVLHHNVDWTSSIAVRPD
jgi:hypothetical protein